ncbi:ADAM 17-like protease [Coccinella septempunctata]|uniref:ADAM 17-like protease n=1 Tax=Coccinella septempunctata TaxID=41139 RepID=UPI001D05E5E2|nr:ADAM 17-like protease [Coccinella septempunctata]
MTFHFSISFFLSLLATGSVALVIKKYGTIHSSDIKHVIVKRGLSESYHPYNKIKELHFNTLGKEFRLELSPNNDILHSNFKSYEIDETGIEKYTHIDKENFFTGRVFGEKSSNVSLHIDDGLMTGSIELESETYHIEPAWRHLSNTDNETMMVYKQSDVKLTWDKDEALLGAKTCGVEDDSPDFEEYHNSSLLRDKRQIIYYEESNFIPTKTRCSLLLVADHTFYKYMGGSSTKKTINYLINLIDRVHKIYNNTVWREHPLGPGFKGMGFLIKKIVVHSAPTTINYDEHYNMDRTNRNRWNVRHLLEVFSRNPDNKNFCLAHLFTHQTFKTSNSVVLGLAYIASPRISSHGGICTKEFIKDGHKVYLNSGLSSTSNHYGQRVITREAELVTAHEFGHNWGSEHDPDIPECSPSSRNNGSYLMYSYSVTGYDKNNKEFSPCSIRSIRKVLESKSQICFSAPERSFCGNSKVEEGEECDAGLFGTEDTDNCCDKECRLRRGAVCSDKNSPCCQGCQYSPRGTVCRNAQYGTCEEQSECTGWHPQCPSSPPVQDGTDCQEKGKCSKGRCVPFCETRGQQSCMCDTAQDACKRCCRSSFDGTCSPPEPDSILPDGTPCMYGICISGHCEKTRPEFVERFWKIIDRISINKILQFFRDNIVGSVIIITAAIWIPACYAINKVDEKRRREKLEWECQDFYEPSEVEQVIRVKVPRRRDVPGYNSKKAAI